MPTCNFALETLISYQPFRSSLVGFDINPFYLHLEISFPYFLNSSTYFSRLSNSIYIGVSKSKVP